MYQLLEINWFLPRDDGRFGKKTEKEEKKISRTFARLNLSARYEAKSLYSG